ncbi:hybrid sensor histidine kinase/response regulator [Azospirillum halopraeferens]|uniref:hybrid sensor histidine kinase/response regulator n=1 Tax=Azospirillum halopraeferens TaxID=34010 RepID=UPI000424850C|nr:hybrid sensor histidine kinase/response regulator [Azospirillum halopraeferens]
MLRSLAPALIPLLAPRTALLAIVVTVCALGAGSWGAVTLLDHRDTLARAGAETGRAAAAVAGQALGVLEPRAARVDALAQRLAEHPDEAADGAAVAAVAGADTAGALAVVDAAGRSLAGPPVAITAGDAYRPARGAGPAVLTVEVGGVASLALARRIAGPDGEPDRFVLGPVPRPDLAAVLDAARGDAALYHPDGRRLIGDGPERWAPDDGARLWSRRPVDGLPLFAGVSVARAAVLAPWWSRLERGAAVVSLSLAALLGVAAVGWRSLHREETAMRALAEANTRLERRVEERTADLSALNRKLIAALADKERANQAKARFLSAANHDLRQPFQALRLFHHLLSERLADPRDRAIADKMGTALDSGEALLHALLEVATLDAGVVKPTIDAVSMDDVLKGVAAEFAPAAAAKGLELRVLPCAATVRSDPVLLARMLRDLVGNAVAYTAGGGVLVGCRRRGQWLRVEVWDTGAGIPPEHLDSIFEDFVQLANPERDRTRGLGLGLAKVRRKAALLGHTVDVRSRPGRGSVFSITVPMAAPEPAAAPSAARGGTGEPRPAARRILVVEDDPVQRAGMQLLLESWGHRVTAAADGGAALAAVRAGGIPDAIVTDFRLPGDLTGVQVVTRIAALADRPVPGIILTGDTAPERIREAVATGCRLLHKPFSPDRLHDALQALAATDPGGGTGGATAARRTAQHAAA